MLSALRGTLIAVATLVLFGASSAPAQTAQQDSAKSAKSNAREDSPLEDFWNWTTRDAVSFYTFILAIFTGVLGTTAIYQIKYLRQANETARKTAEAAKASADALSASERAYVFFTKVSDAGFEPGADGNSITVRTGLKYIITNHGKTPAVLTDIFQKDVLLDWGPNLTLPPPIDLAKEKAQTLPNGIGIGSGEPREFTYELPIIGRSLEYIDVPKRTKILFFMGYIKYADIFKRNHRIGFCTVYDLSAECFRSIGDERYNYTADEN